MIEGEFLTIEDVAQNSKLQDKQFQSTLKIRI